MSRIVRAPYQPGDLADATRLNTDFGAFSQAGAIDAANLRDAAIDLPQLGSGIITLNAATKIVGTGAAGWRHPASPSVPSAVVTPATKFPLVDGAGNPTPLGPIAWTINPGEVLRVYWDLSVKPEYTGTPWTGAGAMGKYDIPQGAGTINAYDGAHFWLVSLQWDVTSAALVNWTEVSGQSAYTSAVGGTVGGRTSDSPASVPIPAWLLESRNVLNGEASGAYVAVGNPLYWTSANGAWYYVPSGTITVYGLRLVIHGVYHSGQTATDNYLVLDVNVGGAGQVLRYDGGTLTAIHQRIGG